MQNHKLLLNSKYIIEKQTMCLLQTVEKAMFRQKSEHGFNI